MTEYILLIFLIAIACLFGLKMYGGKIKKGYSKGAATMSEYVIALFLCAMFAVGTFKTYQYAMRVHYNRFARVRTGVSGMRP